LPKNPDPEGLAGAFTLFTPPTVDFSEAPGFGAGFPAVPEEAGEGAGAMGTAFDTAVNGTPTGLSIFSIFALQ